MTPTGTKTWQTAAVVLPATALRAGLPGQAELAVEATSGTDVQVRFVRVVRLAPPVAKPKS